MSLVVLCPSRGRPDKAKECYQAFLDTRHLTSTEMRFVLDEDDPAGSSYDVPLFHVKRGRPGMTDALNEAAALMWDPFDIVGFIGDDHRFRTSGWDEMFTSVLRQSGPGLVYGNDLIRDDIPTQIFGSSVIWKTLGWMALPTARHLYLDNTWRVLGDSLERLFYMPDVIVEHMHPTVGKAAWDAQYQVVNDPALYSSDGQAFAAWLADGAEADVERVRAVL